MMTPKAIARIQEAHGMEGLLARVHVRGGALPAVEYEELQGCVIEW